MNKNQKILFFILLPLAIILVGVIAFFVIQFLNNSDAVMLNPKGTIGIKERNLIVITTLLMLIVVIPVFILMFAFAWIYRAGNEKAKYMPDWDYNLTAESIWWGLPCVIILVLALITWKATHELDPFKPIDSSKKSMTIQVVALQWKWLFIYPEQKIATVNFVQFPENTPISFELTADAPMNSFWIPQLSGQVFAMPSMRTKLHLIANETGDFSGSSANISGRGFSGMTFIAKASSQADFDQWVQSVQRSQNGLDLTAYTELAKPSEYNPEAFYLLKKDDLFNWVVMKYMNPHRTDMNPARTEK